MVANISAEMTKITTNDNTECSHIYHLAQSVLKIGSVLAERVGRGEVGGCHPLGDSAWGLPDSSSDFGCMLSVGAILFEDRFCASRKGETGRWVGPPLWLTVHGGCCSWL